MGKTYYECHVTIETTERDKARYVVESHKWKFSAIDGDPTLGDGIKCYATRHFNARLPTEYVKGQLYRVAEKIMENGLAVVRRKIELVIDDDRSSTVKIGSCDGACPECHLDDYAGVA